MELKEVYELWDRLEKSTVGEIKLETEGMKLHLKKQASFREYLPKTDNIKNPISIDETVTEHKRESFKVSDNVIKAPIIGVFYHAPSPDKPPYIKEGQEIKKGDVIGIIEAMKMMNEVLADRDGVVSRICVEDGAAVEYDEPLVEVV